MSRRSVLGLASVIAASASSPRAAAQVTVFDLVGTDTHAGFGTDATFVGDVDGDGIDDFAVGSPIDYLGAGGGKVHLYSGNDRTVLRTWTSPGPPNMRYGERVARVSDLDQDGIDDLAVAAPDATYQGLPAGHVWIYSSATGATLYDRPGTTTGESLGWSMADLGDVDGDGVGDFALARYPISSNVDGGVDVVSGATLAVLWSVSGLGPQSRFGCSMAGLGDVDGDGFGDLVVGASLVQQGAGAAYVYSGADGSLLYQVDGSAGEGLGTAVAGPGDWDGDGVPDWCYGLPGPVVPSVCMRSGADGSILAQWSGKRWSLFGVKIAAAGDLNHDGAPDLWVAQPTSNSLDRFLWIDGASGKVRSAVPWPVKRGLYEEYVMISGGDLTGDGAQDLLIGDPTFAADAGRLVAYSIGCAANPAEPYCTTSPNSVGAGAHMGYQGTTSLWKNNFRLLATECPPSQFGLFFYGAEETALPLSDGVLCVAPPLRRFAPVNTNQGTAATLVDFEALPPQGTIVAGSQWRFQFWYRDASFGSHGSNLSDGLLVGFCP